METALRDEFAATASAINRLRSLIVCERPTFHVFDYKGALILYDLCSGALVELTQPTFTLLHGLEEGEPANTIADSVAAAGGLDMPGFVEELEEFHRLGLFRTEPFDEDRLRAQTLDAMSRHSPRNIMLLVHTACNLSCDYCYEVLSGFHYSGGRMSSETAKLILDDYFNRSSSRKSVTVTFFGGEPLLNFSVIRECVDYCQRHEQSSGQRIGFSMTTNGTLLTDDIIEFLVRHKFSVMLSIDGEPDKADLHRHRRDGEGTTQLAVKNGIRLVRAQRAAGIREACVRSTLTKENSSQIDAHRYLHSVGFERVMIGYSAPRAHYPPRAWDLQGDSFAHVVREHETLVEAYASAEEKGQIPPEARRLSKSVADIDSALRHPSPKALLGCGVGNNMLAYTADGRIFPCHRFANEDAYLLGRVDEGGVNKSRLSEFYNDIIDVRAQVCGRCWARYVCIGKCPWELADSDGRVKPEGREGCDDLRRGFERHLWLYKSAQIDRAKSTSEGTEGGACSNG